MATLGLASALGGQRRVEHSRTFLLIAVTVAMVTATAAAMADTFGPVSYDPSSDQLIVTMIYDGTNPDHHFSVQWGRCHKANQSDQPAHQTIVASILDDQWNDAAASTYTTTVKVPLATLSCRPATVTLKTAPDFYTSVDIPAKP
jgi:hypothetical protein